MKNHHMGKKQRQSIQLIEDAFSYLLEQISYSEINVSMICRQATVSRNTFYRMFKSKEAVLKSILARKTKESVAIYEEIISKNEYEQSEELVWSYRSFFEYWYRSKELLSLLAVDDLYELFYNVYIANFGNTTTEQNIMMNANPSVFAHYYLGWVGAGMISALHIWQMHGFRETPEELAAIMIEIRKKQEIKSAVHS